MNGILPRDKFLMTRHVRSFSSIERYLENILLNYLAVVARKKFHHWDMYPKQQFELYICNHIIY